MKIYQIKIIITIMEMMNVTGLLLERANGAENMDGQ